MNKPLAVAALCVALALPVEARVQLVRSYPQQNTHIMYQAEAVAQLQFSEPIIEPQVTITDFAGRVVSGEVELLRDDLVSVHVTSPDPPRPLQGGAYKIEWRVKSAATGEPSSDYFIFNIHEHP